MLFSLKGKPSPKRWPTDLGLGLVIMSEKKWPILDGQGKMEHPNVVNECGWI